MAVVATHLTSNAVATDDDSYTTASVSISTGDLVLLAVGGSDEGSPPVPSGLGLTWALIDGIGSSALRHVWLYRAEAAAGATGAVTIAFPAEAAWGGWTICRITGHAPGGNGAAAIETVDADTGAGQTFSLALSGATPGVTVAASVHDTTNGNTVVTGDTWANLAVTPSPNGRWGSGVDPDGTGTFTFTSSASRTWAAVGVRVVEPGGAEPEHHDRTVAVSLNLAVAAAAAKHASATSSIALGLAVDGGPNKAAQAATGIAIDLDVAAHAVKTAQALADIDLTLGVDALAAKHADVATSLALALTISADPAKMAQVAASLGLNLDIALDGVKSEDGAGTTTIALALAIVAVAAKTVDVAALVGLDLDVTTTAVKHAETTVTIPLALAIAAVGTAHHAEHHDSTVSIGLDLGVSAAATKHAVAVTALALVLAIAATPGIAELAPRFTGALLTTEPLDPARITLVLDPERTTTDG